MRRHIASTASRAVPLLLLDVGNTRVKWALLPAAAVAAPSALTHFSERGVLDLAVLRRSDAPLRRLFRRAPPQTRIFGCNVAGAQYEQRLRSAAVRQGLSVPEWARTVSDAAGVRNGYKQPWRLGVDRWVALIGAHAASPRWTQCLVGIGSALTIDLLDAHGRHLGGCIAPGPQMMIESLLQGTAGIRRRAQLGTEAAVSRALAGGARRKGGPLFARATREALLAGARHACASLIERAARQAHTQVGGRVDLVLAGGGADGIVPFLQIPHRRDDDRVLRGLVVLARERQPIA